MRLRASFELIVNSGGVVRVEARSNHQLTGRDGLRIPELVREFPDADFQATVIASRRHPGVRYVRMRVEGSAVWGWQAGTARRFLNLRPGSADRVALAALAGQGEVRLAWPLEGLEVIYRIPEADRARWRQALDSVGDVTAEQMYEDRLARGYPKSELVAFGVKRRPVKRARRNASPPASAIPYFAARSGLIPRTGRPTLDRVRLPRGERQPDSGPAYWISDEPAENAPEIAARLAEGFSQNGVWPLLWSYGEDPQAYMQHAGDPDQIDTLNPETLLADWWAAYAGSNPLAIEPFGPEFPGLSPANTPSESPRLDPFSGHNDPPGEPARLLLVPANRPADTVTTIGGLACEIEGSEISAILRSWEQRFDAVVIAVAPSTATLAIGTPPTTPEQAVLLAAELWAFCPPETGGQPAALKALANPLTTAPDPSRNQDITRDRWQLRWTD